MPIDYQEYILPVYEQLPQIVSNDDVVPKDSVEEEEYPHLLRAIELIHGQIKDIDARRARLLVEMEDAIFAMEYETGDDREDAVKTYNKLLKRMRKYIKDLNHDLTIIEKPYFGKIVFKNHKTSKPVKVYIGKFAMIDPSTGVPLITDWRAPIANLYYQHSGPTENVDFTSPAGKITGDLTQKRQFEIVLGRFQNIYDIKSGNSSADEFLLHELAGRSGKKLVDIVSTIQKTQNEIIRAQIDRPIILQGVAGSGKTTILLHRLAYLAYSQESKISMNKALVLAPNKMFIDYISELLPNLGIFGTQTDVYMSLAKKILKWDDRHVLSDTPDNLEIKSVKGSYAFYRGIRKAFARYVEQILDELPESVKWVVTSRYEELRNNHSDIDIYESLELAVRYAFNQKEQNMGVAGDYMGQLRNIKDKEAKVLKLIKKRLRLRNMYLALLKDHEAFESEGIPTTTMRNIEAFTKSYFNMTGKVQFHKQEDIPLLLELSMSLYGYREYVKDVIMVDEAQDYSIAQLLTIAKLAGRNNLMLAGDLAQAIIPPFYIKDWQDVIEILRKETGGDTIYTQLNKSYRTTVEIIDYTNTLLTDFMPKGLNPPEAVLRHGDPVETISIGAIFDDADEQAIKDIIRKVNEQFDKGASTVGIITRDLTHFRKVHRRLVKHKNLFTRKLHTESDDNHSTGVLVLPVAKAKGLEFDSVFIIDVDEPTYGRDEYSQRLLYVAMTRALHRLFIVGK